MSSRKIYTDEDKKVHLKTFMEACDHVEQKYKESSLSDIMDREYHLMRSRLHRLAVPLLGDTKYGKRVLETLWKSAFYSLIRCMRGSILSEQQKGWCDMQLSILVGELTRIGIQFADLQTTVFIYLGDLRRYAWLFFSRERDQILATLHYRSVTEMDSGNGLVYNQLGLLVQNSDPVKAILYFFLASSFSQRPFPGAFANVLGLLAKCATVLEDPIVAVIEHSMTIFSRFEFQDLMNAAVEHIETQLDAKDALYVSRSISLLTLAVLVLISKEKQAEARSLIEMLLKVTEETIKALEDWISPKISVVRRRRASECGRERYEESSGEESLLEDEDDGEDIVELDSDDAIHSSRKVGELDARFKNEESRNEAQMLQVSLLHFAIASAAHIYNNKSVPTALKHQYETFCQNLCRHLNEANYILTSSSHLPLWHLGSSESFKLLPTFLEEFAMAEDTPVQYDGFFRFVAKSSREENLMKNMAKMRLIHETKQEEARAWMPVYVVPEKEVLIQRPWVLKGIVKKGTVIVVIAEDTLREMDKLKKEKSGAREAIRFIESQVSNPNRRLRIENGSSTQQCAEKLAAQTQLTDAVIVVILTMSKVDNKVIPKSAIMTMNAEKFYHTLS